MNKKIFIAVDTNNVNKAKKIIAKRFVDTNHQDYTSIIDSDSLLTSQFRINKEFDKNTKKTGWFVSHPCIVIYKDNI